VRGADDQHASGLLAGQSHTTLESVAKAAHDRLDHPFRARCCDCACRLRVALRDLIVRRRAGFSLSR
jgi:hypothetical protein